jgi:hypothetical protein
MSDKRVCKQCKRPYYLHDKEHPYIKIPKHKFVEDKTIKPNKIQELEARIKALEAKK